MCPDTYPYRSRLDEDKAYQEIEEQIGHCTPEQAWAMYFVSTGTVREHITLAVMEHIGRGNKALLFEFPELAMVERGERLSG